MQLFFNSELTENDKQVSFSKDESRHIAKVLRKNPGDSLHITNGNGLLFKARLSLVSAKQCAAEIEVVEASPPPPFHLHLAVAPTKMNDRYEWFLEKATEIGISEITPIICEHSERRHIKSERFNRIITTATKQSLRAWKPRLNEAVSFAEFLSEENKAELKCIAHCESSKKTGPEELIQKGKSVCILIGPEGDFSSEEINLAVEKGFQPIHLGENRLRTETAAIVACHTAVFLNQIK